MSGYIDRSINTIVRYN